jgi:hypothetical protein
LIADPTVKDAKPENAGIIKMGLKASLSLGNEKDDKKVLFP